MTNELPEIVLLIGGPSGVGKTTRPMRTRSSRTCAHARKNVLYGQWLTQEAERRGLPVVPARPWDSLADRVLIASGLPTGRLTPNS